MGLIRKVVAVLLVALWPAATSHALLEQLELIHVVHEDHHHHDDHHDADHSDDGKSHEHGATGHQFADGDYAVPSHGKSISKPQFLYAEASLIAAAILRISQEARDAQGPAPPGAAPPLLQKTWQFSVRTALPVRAPSFIS